MPLCWNKQYEINVCAARMQASMVGEKLGKLMEGGIGI